MAKVHLDLTNARFSKEQLNENYGEAMNIVSYLREDKEAYTGWVNWPVKAGEDLFGPIEKIAAEIREKCEVLVVIGIGGSYLGTIAILEALGGGKEGRPEIVYAGNSMSGPYHAGVIEQIGDRDFCICVVSKSGETMESKIAFTVFKDLMKAKYGSIVPDRIVAITDPVKGSLRKEAEEAGYYTLEVPSNIGGRYSAFTPAILFPLTVAGVDIRTLVSGAADMAKDDEFWKNEGIYYALGRFALIGQGKVLEAYEFYEPRLRNIGEWLKQLFAESEGKEGKGIFPASMIFSTDLHSIGQFLQEGNPVFFETVIDVDKWDEDVTVPDWIGNALGGMSLNAVNKTAVDGVIAAHAAAGTPIFRINIDDCKEYSLGQFLYFCMLSTAVTGKLMKIDPFNQPGVEQYKIEVKSRLGI